VRCLGRHDVSLPPSRKKNCPRKMRKNAKEEKEVFFMPTLPIIRPEPTKNLAYHHDNCEILTCQYQSDPVNIGA
jgi:hypothetical protein